MTTRRANPPIGGDFDDFLEEEGIKEEVEAGAFKSIVADQIRDQMRKKKISKAKMAKLMHTSRSSLDRLLDPRSHTVTLVTVAKAASVLGKEVKISFV